MELSAIKMVGEAAGASLADVLSKKGECECGVASLPITINNVEGDPDPYTGEQKMIYYYNLSVCLRDKELLT